MRRGRSTVTFLFSKDVVLFRGELISDLVGSEMAVYKYSMFLLGY